MATLTHFDMSADDPDRAMKFYNELFGWKFNLLPGPMNYYLIETKDLNGKTAIGGGMSKRTEHQQGVVNYIGVSSIDESIQKVKQLGGKIVQEKQAVPGYGMLAVCLDTENNLFGLFQETSEAIPGEQGSLQAEPKTFCQSCSMPIDDVTMRGTEKDGKKSEEYCKYCYVNGAFVNPEVTLEEMKEIVTVQLKRMNSPSSVTEQAIRILPELKRWKKHPVVAFSPQDPGLLLE
ncbi:MAG TPA: zinc ribbon domain-containing protein [Bacteroidia bacterium]|jgi:predicted enzyme related to lactoylglutathione lyase|nr:zinc ribbon domain-containing protein [Bacteroidia bacterium]